MKKMPYYNAKLGIWLGQWDILLCGRAFLPQGSVFLVLKFQAAHGTPGLRANDVGIVAPAQISD